MGSKSEDEKVVIGVGLDAISKETAKKLTAAEIRKAVAKDAELLRKHPLPEREPSEDLPEWSEGVRFDGAVILRDGVPVPIHAIVKLLNRYERMVDGVKEDPDW